MTTYYQAGENLRNSYYATIDAIKIWSQLFELLHRLEAPPYIEGLTSEDWEIIFVLKDLIDQRSTSSQ
jgi:hypothetical protein